MSRLSGDFVISRLQAIMPEQEALSLYPLSATETFPGTPVTWNGKREPANLDDRIGAQLEATEAGIVFELWDPTGALTAPKVGDKIVDALNVSWSVRRVDPVQMFRRVYRCTCIRFK